MSVVRTALLLAAISTLVASCGQDNRRTCDAPMNVAVVPKFAEAPASLQLAVLADLRDFSEPVELVEPDQPFDVGDVVVTGNSRRLLFIWHSGNRWVIATEHGGIGYNNPILAYDVDPRNQSPALVEKRIAYPDTLCAEARELIQDAPRESKITPPRSSSLRRASWATR